MNIDETALKAIVAKAIFDGITPEQRQELLTKAINTLLTTPATTVYGVAQPSPLLALFQFEVQNMARDLIRERFKSDQSLKTLLDGIVSKTIAALAADDDVAQKIATAIANAFEKANSQY